MSRSVEELLDAPAGAMDALWPLVAAAPAQSRPREDELAALVPMSLGACSIADEMLSYRSITPLPDGNWAMEVTRRKGTAHPAGAMVRGYVKGNEYGPLPNRSVAHPFLLAAFHSKFIGDSSTLRVSRFVNHFR